MQILSYARGFESWGPLVRMIIKIMLDVRHFLFIMIILCLGFAMAFSVAIPAYNPLAWLLWMINTGVYGYSEIQSAPDADERPHLPIEDWEHAGNAFLFEVCGAVEEGASRPAVQSWWRVAALREDMYIVG